MSKAYAESRARKAQEQRRKEEEKKKRQKQQAQVSKSAGKSAVGGALRGATASKSTGKAYRPAVESPSYDWLSGTTRTPSQFGQKSYDDNKATPYQQYMQNADAISSADALNRYMQQANDYFNSTYTDRNAGMKLRNSGLMSGVQSANAAGQKVHQYFSSNPQIYSNGKYAEEKANYDRISSEVADPALDYKLRARTGDASVFNENMDDTTRSQARRYFRQSQFENFTNAMKQGLANGRHVGGSAQKQYSDREIAEIMAGKVPDFKATQAVTGGADTYQGVADMLSAYSRDQVASDVETVTYQDGTAREIQAAAERLDALVGSGYSARLQQNWSKDPNVRMEALNAYDANEQMLSNYYDQTVGANSPDEVKTTYEDYKNYLVGYNKQLAKEAKDEKLRQQIEADFGGKVQSANAKKSSGGTVAAAFAGLRGQEATKKQQGVYTMIAEGYDAARKAGYIDEWQDAQGHDPVTREYYDSGYDHMTDEEKDNFISLYNDPTQGPEVAFEYLNRLKYFTQQRDAYEMEKWTSDLAQNGFLGAAAATGVGIAAGYANNAASLYVMTDRLINGDKDGKYNEYSPELRYSLIHDVALGTVGQVIEDATPNLELAGINIPKAFYNAATSAAESFLNAVSFDHFGAVAMGVGAAGSSYRSNLEKVGSVQVYTEKDAFIDGAFDGFVETLTEYVSVENLLNPTLSPMKNAVRAPLTEMSEEVLGYLLDNGYDTIKYGSRGEIAQRYDELLVQGYSDAEARATITQEMAQELTETILVAGLSGGMMGGPQAIAAQVENNRVGSKVQQNDNVTGLLDLADTLELPDDVRRMSAEQRSASEKGEKVSNAKLGRILRESMAKLDESGQKILSESAEKLAKNVLLENGYDGDNVNLNALAKKVVRLVSGKKLTELEMNDVARSNAATKAVQALTERTSELKKIDEKTGKLDSLMKPREAAQTEISDRLKEASVPQEVTEAFDESVAKADEAVAKATEKADSDALSAEDERAVRLESFASEYGKNADVMQNAINDGQDADAYARAFKVAEVRGEDGQSFDVVKKLSVLSDLTENQVRIAYELGRGIRGARSAQLRQNTNYSGTQVQVGNVDTSAIKGHLTGAQQRSIDAARSVAQALGVNIRFFESAANEIGQYTAENGSFDGDTMTISLDIHAGSNSKFNTDYAVMQTLGHELTHFVKSFADSEVFNAYQDFVIGHLSEKMDVDAEVERVTALSAERGVNLSRDGAIEEIIANASGEALMNITQEQITQLAQANPSLAKRIGNRIQEWVKKVLDRIRAAYKGGGVRYEVARQMQDVLTEMSEKWNNALVNAAQNRFGTKNQQQETDQQAETAVENSVENSETVHAEEPDVKTEALTEETQSAQEEAESKPQPIAGRHIDQRTTDSVKGVDMDLFSSEGEQIQVGFAEAAKILLADLNNTIRGDKTFISDGGADQTVLGQKRMTSALLEEIKDQTGWTWERIGKSLRAFVLAGETGDLVKNTVTNRTMELYLNEMLTDGYTTLDGVKLTPWGEYVDFVQGLEGAKEHAVREVKGAIPFEDYAFADVEEAADEEGNDLRFSLREPVERTNDLIAVHNLTEQKLKKALALGGFPMPSIAVTKSSIGHSTFGDISRVFSSDTIDPKANRKNKVYSADAWTPTFPQIDYEVNAAAHGRIVKRLETLSREVDSNFSNDLRRIIYSLDDYLNRQGGESGLVEYVMDNVGLKAAYLEEHGQHIPHMTKQTEVQKGYAEDRVDKYRAIADELGTQDADALGKMPIAEIRSEHGEALDRIFPGMMKSEMRMIGILRQVRAWLRESNSGPEYETVTDVAAMRRAVDDALNSSDYRKWVQEMFSGIEGNSGVYNNKGLYTPSGNRRSFASTHYPVTLENIAKAMAGQNGGNAKNVGGFYGAKTLRAATAETFRSVDEMRRKSSRLQALTQEQIDARNSALNDRLYAIIDEVSDGSKSIGNRLAEMDTIGQIIAKIAEGRYSVSSIQNTLGEYRMNVSEETARKIKNLLDDIAQMPVNMFEAKPERAVRFDEVKYAVVPASMNENVRSRLEELVPDVRTYADGDEAQRLELLNARDDLRFQIRYQDDANQISDRELLASALDTVAQNDTERDYLKRYRKYIKELEQKQSQLDDLSARLKDLKADKASAKANRDLIMRMENNAKTLENSIQRTDKRLMDFEATKALKDVMAREKAAWKQTAKARSDARVERLRESNRANTQARVDAARERVRASYERKLEAKLEKAKAAMEKKTDRIVDRLENKLERNEARFEERIAKMKESEKRTEYRRRILEDSAAMREWLTTPTNKAHVPEFLRAPLGDFLKSINYSSDSLLRGKGETKADAALIDAMERMSRALAQTRTQPDSLSTAEGYMGYLDLPSGFESEFNEMLDRVKGAMESGADVTDTPLNRMTSAQLKTLSDAIRTLNTSVRNMNRLIANGRYQTARDASASTIEELTKLGDRKKTGAVRDALSGWIDWKSATPFYAFQRFGEGGKAIFEGIQDGWDRMAFNVKQVLDFTKSAYTPKQVRQWSRETHSVELSSKKKVQMTTAQLMSLYCLSRREQAMKHLQGGGIRIASFKTKGGTVNQAENYTLSTADISKLTGMLTAEQIEVADKLQAFMSSVCADWGNEVSMQRFGYNAFTEENYFPIETDSNNRAAVDESARENDLFRLLNLSATKALVQNANNAVVIQDIFDVFAAHAADMAKYNGLALPILDTLKWYNYVEKTRPVNGQFTTQSVQKSLEAAYGRDAQKYVTNFLRDLNGKMEGGRNDGLINRMISNYKVAAVGANLRVGFLQITSMPRAAYVISPKYLAVGVAKNVAFRNSPIAERKVGIALWKSLGFYDTNISRNIRDLIKNDAGFFEKTRDLSMTLAEKGDYWTMGVIYGAVEAEMADKHADVKKNTAKYDQMVNDRMREIIYKTQVVDSTMTRSDIMRGKGLASIASAFMSEPMLTMNLLSESVYEARMKARAGDSKSVAQALVGSRKFGKALAATTVVCALSAVFEAVFSAYRDDDEYETFLEKFNDALVGDLSGADGGWEKFQALWNGSIMDNFKLWNNIVFVKDISEALAGDSGDAAMWAAGFGDLAKGVQQLYKSILGDGGKPLYGSIYTTLKGVSELSGIPMSAATRDTIGLYNTIAGEMGWKRLQTSNDKPSDAAEAILRVEENGNTVLADRYRRIAGEHGIDEAKLQSAMKSAIQSRFDAGRIEDQRAAELLEDYAGKDADEASVQVARWRYAKDTGLKYGDMKEDYLSGLLDEATALRYLTAEIGADKAAARIDRWNFEQIHGEDADYSSRWKLWEAFEGSGSYDGKTAEQYVREWAKTTDKKNIAAAIAGRYKDEYLRIKGTPAGNSMLEKLLNLYVAAGYEREYEREYIDKKWVK